MSKAYRLVVLDWEGTLSDTLGLAVDCIVQEAQKRGPLDRALVYQHMEGGIARAIKKLYPAFTIQEYEKFLHAVQRAMVARHTEVYLIPGAREFVLYLYEKGVALAIASNKSQAGLDKAVRATGLDAYFFPIYGTGRFASKPHPAMLQALLQDFDVSPKKVVMITDSPLDIEMAVSLQIEALGLDFYRKQADSLHKVGATEVFFDYSSLLQYIKDMDS